MGYFARLSATALQRRTPPNTNVRSSSFGSHPVVMCEWTQRGLESACEAPHTKRGVQLPCQGGDHSRERDFRAYRLGDGYP